MRNNFFYSLLVGALLLHVAVYGVPAQASTCPAQNELQFQPDGHFVTASGWHSDATYEGISNPLPVLKKVTITLQTSSGQTHFEGCHYEIISGQVLSVLMVPPVTAPVSTAGENWYKLPGPPSTVIYRCMVRIPSDICEFNIDASAEADTNVNTSPAKNIFANPFGR